MWYFTTHGVGPGTLPKDVSVIKVEEGYNSKGTYGDWVKTSRPLTIHEIKYYDLREQKIEFIKIVE